MLARLESRRAILGTFMGCGNLGLVFGLVVLIAPVPHAGFLEAQETRPDAETTCAQAATVVRAFDQAIVQSSGAATQGPGKLYERSQAVATLLRCGAVGGREAAAAIRLTRHLADVALIDQLTSSFSTFRDTAVIAASVEVATDATASISARIVALHTMWTVQTGKFWFGVQELYPPSQSPTENATARCGQGMQFAEHTPSWQSGAEPAVGFGAAIQAVAKRLIADPSQPSVVRTAALCVLIP